jgi:DNA-binding PadR family transcriptional regulator
MEKKFTKRDFYQTLIAKTKGEITQFDLTDDDIVTFCENELALLNKRAENAKNAAAKKKADGDALTDAIAEVLTDEFTPIADIVAKIDGDDITPAKVTYRLNALVADGIAEKQQITVDKRKIQGYKLAN